jgi:hypothetical protein
LCFWFGQITRTTPRRRTILHLSQIRLTDALTFIEPSSLRDDSPAAPIRRHQLHMNPITDQHPDEVPVDPIRNVRQHLPAAIVEPHAIHRAWQHVDDHSR